MTRGRSITCSLIFSSLLAVTSHAAAAGAAADGTEATEESTQEARNVVARVNGKPIYEDRLDFQVDTALRKYRRHGLRKEDPDLVKRLETKALDGMIADELIYQQSQALTIEDIDEKIEQRLKALEGKYGNAQRMQRHLSSGSLTTQDLRKSVRARIYVDEYLKQQDISEPEIPEELIREMYERNPSSYSRAETIKVSHVLIAADENAGAEEKEGARQTAGQVRREILDGKDFAAMARKHSDCNSASGGGGLGYIKRGYMPAEFDGVAFALDTNAVSDVVETKFGYHIIKVSDKKAGGVTPYEEARDLMKKLLQQEEAQKRLAAHVAGLKARAKIEILLQQ